MRFCLGILLFLAMVCVSQAGGICSTTTVSAGYVHNQAVILAVPVVADYYYTVGGNDQRIADEVIRRLESRFQFGSPSQPAPSQPAAPSRLDRSAFRLAGNGGGSPSPSSSNHSSAQVLAVLERTCVQCHKPGSSKPGNIQLFTAERTLFVDADPARELRRRQRVYDSVQSGDMPKGGRPLPSSEKAILEAWVQQVRNK